MRRIKTLILAVVATFILCSPFTVEAASSNVFIGDNADLLTPEEEGKLLEYLSTLNSDYKYLVITSDTYEYGDDVDSRLATYYDNAFSRYDDGIAFIIDMYSREIYIEAFGDIQNRIKDSDAYDITDNIYTYASKGDYYTCVQKAFNQADTLVNKGFILRPMRYIVSLLIAVVLGFLFAFYTAMFERSKHKTTNANAQILMTGAAIAATSTIYDTKKIRKSSSSGGHSGGFSGGSFSGGGFSGGGFSGGGHSSGGGFSGGGGGHSGGGHSF
ncbi:MAG: TPM domain-containing protein [Pseudobutyrivibrio sp.]|nr:TPM domain-containing protein [Pseudobutyrivibrio sp.]